MRARTLHRGYFTALASDADAAIAKAVRRELERQQEVIELIASENIVSRAVMDVQGSVLTNKTVEGYVGRRYHGGATYVDIVEKLAIERACELFGCRFTNVQPHSGSQANHAVLHAVANPGETILSMDLNAGGHLSHGSVYNFSGQWFNVVSSGVRLQDALIDYGHGQHPTPPHPPNPTIPHPSPHPPATPPPPSTPT